ncbi:MAG: tripartite tricarboxylate transporter TctB family protein [Betaproteobacteria bacterium]|nr:MAG: tripartite tricarboxylate transporter TctB family protein [Betaproteobacteria bacterium]
MEKAEAAAGILILIIGAVLLIAAYPLPYMVESVPGPGFLPLWVSLGIIASGAAVTVSAVRGRLRPGEPIPWPDLPGWRQVGVMLVALALALVLFDDLGFVITTTAFMTIVIFSLGVRSWVTLITAPIAAAAILYAVFALWLGVPLPQGILTFMG